MNTEKFNPHLEIQVVEHCNLNCASCTHFSPLAEPSFIDTDRFFEQLKKANKIFNTHCKSLKIMGGEPLLHPSIDELLYFARKAMPTTNITVQTNGILLTKMNKDFWVACRENDILVRVTRYPVKMHIEEINGIAERYEVNLKFHPSDSVVKSFNLYPIDVSGKGNEEDNYSNCRMKCRYVLIKDDKLYPCPIAGNAEHFNMAFGTNLDCSDKNYMNIDCVNSFDKFVEFAGHAIAFCKYCKPTEYKKNIGWSHSQKKITEWT